MGNLQQIQALMCSNAEKKRALLVRRRDINRDFEVPGKCHHPILVVYHRLPRMAVQNGMHT